MDSTRKTETSGKSPEEIAYKLFHQIVEAEQKEIRPGSTTSDDHRVDREWILATFAQCMQVVRHPTQYLPDNFDRRVKRAGARSATGA